MPKIKSIQFKQVKIIETEPNAKITDHGNFFAVQKEGSEIPDYWVGKEYIEGIEYESKILKRPDGSVISGLEEGEKVWILKTGFLNEDGDEEYFSSLESYRSLEHKIYLKKGYIFEKKDTDLAEKKAQMLNKKLEIQFEIDRLNAEQGWVANWWTVQDKYILESESDDIHTKVVIAKNVGQTPMSPTTAKTILAKYSQEELQQYLGKII